MGDSYTIRVHTDAHEPDTVTETYHTLGTAVSQAIAAAERMATEDGHVLIGEAGHGEALEVYPEFGAGTVVIDENE